VSERRSGRPRGSQPGSRIAASGWLSLPAVAWLALFFLVPAALILRSSFGESAIGASGVSIDLSRLGLDRYRQVFDGPLLSAFRNTLWISVVGTLACLVLALPVAYWLAIRAPRRVGAVLLALLVLPYWISALIRSLSLRILLAPNGLVSGWLQDLGLLDEPLRLVGSRLGVLIGVIYNYLPLMVLPLYIAFRRLDPELRTASRDLYGGKWATLTGVTLPLVRPGVLAAVVLVFIPLAGDYVSATVLGGAKGAMAGSLVVSQFLNARDWATGSATAVVLTGLILGTIAVAAIVEAGLRALAGLAGRVRVPAGLRNRGHGRSPRWATPLFALVCIAVALQYGPILLAFGHTFTDARAFTQWGGFTFENYPAAWQDAQITRAVRNSFEVALASTAIAAVIGTFAGIVMGRRRGAPTVRALAVAAPLVLVTPEIVMAVAQLLWLSTLGGPFDTGLFGVDAGALRMVVAHSVPGAAIVALLVQAVSAASDVSVEEAAADLGASEARIFADVTVRQLLPAILAGSFLAFSLSLDTTVVSSFLATVDTLTYPALLLAQVRNTVSPALAVGGLAITAFTLTSLTVAAGLFAKRSSMRRALGGLR
jgi:ABC-type spermidine/putrescine transport system permease subunit I